MQSANAKSVPANSDNRSISRLHTEGTIPTFPSTQHTHASMLECPAASVCRCMYNRVYRQTQEQHYNTYVHAHMTSMLL
jgi:hypothetical protein